MLINPPNDYGMPQPQFMEEKAPNPTFDAYRKTQLFLNVKNWKCPECGAVVFGRVLECVICKFMFHRITPRPAHYTKKGGA
jgi:rubredoxin